ncbi:MAG TPA: TIGR03619 family F420-dependent LLM class oxidoreductase [Acidimicrobiales bacterium]|nr:TIGR03619 family F420-dependent LLM class oxidoreductase [Acidimicrobiales bacterium]
MTPKLGILTPVVTLVPRAHARWERDATIDDVARIAEAADRLGYDHLTCSEHVAVPELAVAERGGRYWDPLATFGYLAGRTTRIRFATNVLVLGYHHPLAIAKRYGTLDRIAQGRLVLGLGVGSLEEEFALLDVPFADRGARADDALRALRVALSDPAPAYDGEYYSFKEMVLDPAPMQTRVPFWIGGRTPRSLRRAVELADGWCPFWLSAQKAATILASQSLPGDFDVVLQTDVALDPSAKPDEARRIAASFVDAGATILSLRFVHHSVDHYIEQLEAMVKLLGQ